MEAFVSLSAKTLSQPDENVAQKACLAINFDKLLDHSPLIC